MPSQDLQRKLTEGYNLAAHSSIENLIVSEYEKPTIGVIAKANKSELVSFFSKVIGHEIAFWKVGKDAFSNDGEKQAAETIKLIIEAYSHLKVADIRMVFKMAKLAEFGATFDRMDGATILEWFKKYDSKRLEAETRLKEKQHTAIKTGSVQKIESLLTLPVSTEITDEMKQQIEAARQKAMDKLRSIEIGLPMKTFTEAEIKAGEERSRAKDIQRAANEKKIAQTRKKQQSELFNGVSKEQYIADCEKHGISYDLKQVNERFKDSENV